MTEVPPLPHIEKSPLVSVGIPTYNRLPMLKRAIQSVLQDAYANLELVISDNASTDGTRDYCAEIARNDPRVRYLRHETNKGAHENFMTALRSAQGTYFMWLGDDDWIDAGYIPRCVETLENNPGTVLVCGRARYYQNDSLISEEMGMSLLQDSALERLLRYFRVVSRNGEYYGLMRRSLLLRTPYPKTIGGDWSLIASMACRGKFSSLPTISINRALGGATANAESVVNITGSTGFLASSTWLFWLAIAAYSVREIISDPTAYAPLNRIQRIWAGLLVFSTIFRRYVRPEMGNSLRQTKVWKFLHPSQE